MIVTVKDISFVVIDTKGVVKYGRRFEITHGEHIEREVS